MSEVLELRFLRPGPIPTDDELYRMRRGRREEVLSDWRDLVRWAWRRAAAEGGIGNGRGSWAPGTPATVRITLPFPDRRRRSSTRYSRLCGELVEALVRLGAWPEATNAHVYVCDPEIKKAEHVVIRLEAR